MPPPPLTPTFGWLLCPPIKQRPSKAEGLPISLIFLLLLNSTAQTVQWHPSHTFRPGLPSSPIHPLSSPPTIGWLLFITIKQRPSKAKAPPFVYYLMPLILPPQMSEPTTASASPTACNLCMVVGSNGTMIWWHRCSTHGKRKGKAAGGRVAAAHVCWLVVVCVVCVVCCVLCFVVVFCVLQHCYHTGSKTILAKLKWLSFAHSYHKICT